MNGKTSKIVAASIFLSMAAYGIYYFTRDNKKNNKLPATNPQESDSTILKNTVASAPASSRMDNAVFTTNTGYQKFDSGLIIQFGYGGGKKIIFPTPFPTTCLSVVVSTERSSSGSRGFNHVTNVTKTGFTPVLDGKFGYWIAMGY